MASSFISHPEKWEVSIHNITENKGVIFYVLHMRINAVQWTVNHRYSDFSELNKTLVLNHGISKDILPGKTLFHIRNDTFIESRRLALEKYIKEVVRFLSNTMPPILVSFLDMDKYDLWFLLKNLSNKITMNGWIENPPGSCEINIIEVIYELSVISLISNTLLKQQVNLGPKFKLYIVID